MSKNDIALVFFCLYDESSGKSISNYVNTNTTTNIKNHRLRRERADYYKNNRFTKLASTHAVSYWLSRISSRASTHLYTIREM